VKLNASGSIEWQRSLGGSNNDFARSIQQTTDGGYIVAGYSESNDGDVTGNHGSLDYWVVKLDSTGNIVWQKCLGGSHFDWALSIQQTGDGGYIVAGESWSIDGDVTGNHGVNDYWIVKLSPETGISEHFTPQKLAISVNPNPFNSACAITAPEDAIVEIFDIEGRKINKLPGGEQVWKPEVSVGSGVYLVRAKIGDKDITKRIVYLK